MKDKADPDEIWIQNAGRESAQHYNQRSHYSTNLPTLAFKLNKFNWNIFACKQLYQPVLEYQKDI